MSLIVFLPFIFFFVLPMHAYRSYPAAPKPFSIMIDPAGDAKTPGRIIDGSFERGLTLQFAEMLKRQLESDHPHIRVILTRVPEETIEPLQNANFANRIDVDLYLSIHFYQEKEALPKLYLYHFVYAPITDLWVKPQKLAFHPYDQAHLSSLAKTMIWIEQIHSTLRQDAYHRLFEVKGIFSFPFRPLIGIKSPAIALEVGLKHKQDWQRYIKPVAQAISNLLIVIGQPS